MRQASLSEMDERVRDEFEIRRLIENWVVWRDAGEFERFAELWHPESQMIVTWAQTTGADFTARAKAGFESGGKSLHMLGGSSIDVSGTRAYAQTKVAIKVRGLVHGAEVDVTSYGRFVDFLEKLEGRWLLYLRTVIYELDEMIPTEAGRRIELDAELLSSYPEGYRHLAYMMTQAGMAVKPDLPGTRGPEVEALYARARAWLAGE